MAKQHFYTRVPARISIYYKANGFDTFAQSKDISLDFIEKELNHILEQKPSQEELTLLRKGELAPIYCQFSTSDKTLVQSCVSFLREDYTGERSSYLVHSLLMDDIDEHNLHYAPDVKAIDENNFVHDLDEFDITGASAKPIENYPEKRIESTKLDIDVKTLIDDYDPGMLVTFIFAAIASLAGKIKSVHVVLPNNKNFENSLSFFNRIIQLFPYNYRKDLSFVSRVTDFTKYSNFKIKVIHESMGPAPTNKGVTINFITKEVTGIKEKDYALVGNVPEFLYRLISKEEERLELFRFFQYVTNKEETLNNSDYKNLLDLIFLFKCGSGLYDEMQTLPNDDAILNFLTAYEKDRNALSDEYRMTAMKCLKRYHDNYTVIPKQVFAKISKLYPYEIVGTKHIIMTSVLDLIHTDLMRNQLFAFIKANFDKEPTSTKEEIIIHLASVFNGEFLQSQILEVFYNYFDKGTKEARKTIIDNLVMAFRTKAIQDNLFTFLTDKYRLFNDEEKTILYNAAIEQLLIGDDLTKKIFIFLDEHIVKEDKQIQKAYLDAVEKILLAEQRKGTNVVFSMIAYSKGYTFKAVTHMVFTEWKKRKIFGDYVALCWRGSFDDKIEKVILTWKDANINFNPELSDKYIEALVEAVNLHPTNTTVEDIYKAKTNVTKSLRKVDNSCVDDFIEKFINSVIDPVMINNYADVFKSTEEGAVEKLVKYAKTKKDIKENNIYSILNNYLTLKDAVINANFDKLHSSLTSLYKSTDIARNISNYLLVDIYNGLDKSTKEALSSDALTYVLMAFNYLKSGHYKLTNVYNKLIELVNDLDASTNKYLPQDASCLVAKAIFNFASFMNDDLKEDVLNTEYGITPAATDIVSKYGNRQLQVIIKAVDNLDKDVIKNINDSTKKVKSKANIFSRVYNLC